MKVVILAGGFGTRFSEKTRDLPKPLIEIGGKPILWHIMKIYSHYGFNDFIICLGYKGELIKEYFYNMNIRNQDITIDYRKGFEITSHNSTLEPWRITLIDTGLNTMTGGRLKRIAPYLDEDEDFMLTYGDGVSDIDIPDLIKTHKNNNTLVTLTAVRPVARYGNLSIEGNIISEFREKSVDDNQWINGGFFVASKKLLDYIDGDDSILERKPLETLAAEKQLSVYKHYGFWKSMDILKEMLELNALWTSGKAPWKLWE